VAISGFPTDLSEIDEIASLRSQRQGWGIFLRKSLYANITIAIDIQLEKVGN
jgi:hypothetical protein